MNIAILTNEYPPHIYGGAGVHVEYLTRELTALEERTALGRGSLLRRPARAAAEPARARGPARVQLPAQDPRHAKFLDTMLRDLMMAGTLGDVDVVHCHTWYTHLAGCLVKQLTGAPLVLTTHSLEPHRPWKVEQLGTAYHVQLGRADRLPERRRRDRRLASRCAGTCTTLYGVPAREDPRDPQRHRPRTSTGRRPTLRCSQRYRSTPTCPSSCSSAGSPGRRGSSTWSTRSSTCDPGVQVVLCAGAPDTPEIGREMTEAVDRARAERPRSDHLDPRDRPQGRHHQRSTRTPRCSSARRSTSHSGSSTSRRWRARRRSWPRRSAASRRWSRTGKPDCSFRRRSPARPTSNPKDPAQFSRDLAEAVNRLLADPALRAEHGA